MNIKLKTGTLDTANNMDGWIITSPTATIDGYDEETDMGIMPILKKGDKIYLNGDIRHNGEIVANIA